MTRDSSMSVMCELSMPVPYQSLNSGSCSGPTDMGDRVTESNSIRGMINSLIRIPLDRKRGHPMAQKVHIVLVDDLDGSEATESVSFGLDGTSYEIDLNDANAARLRDALAEFVGHARKVGSATRRGRRPRRRPPPGRRPERQGDPRLGPLQRVRRPRPRPRLRRGPRGLRRRPLTPGTPSRRSVRKQGTTPARRTPDGPGPRVRSEQSVDVLVPGTRRLWTGLVHLSGPDVP